MDKSANIDQLIEQFKTLPGGLLPLLRAVKHAVGYIPDESVPQIAKGFNLSRAEVHGVISFYHDFNTSPGGQHCVQICRAEACQSMGSRQIEAHAKKSLGIEYGETTKDGKVTLQPVYCLGNCACSPSIRINDDIHARVSAASFDQLMSELCSPVTNDVGAKK
ncbi:MAG: formate dehydrogenase subunit gamma [Porticoccaceae bacterium]|nr:formate dehydrogenase subunit gamma [Porticoccaceae bacterium]MBT3799127.1 formate dehydrogenase subunit gamma [Porticoccaceae bacterium]MBT4164079.1 formate dehydrogenase subunit gamma [Porticoccaceae bacterium]MBT4210518.1 formate dehydrogenase subunit gamma [Porticoccaceae bacterium]MBT4591560.1 formate dehydrogenase subunit gamma [Porticoccaceae bacterium]